MKTSGWGLTLLRLTVGTVFVIHGGQKLFIFGFGHVGGMLQHMGFPLPQVFGVILTLVEFFGGVALILGIFTRWAALLIAIDMAVAVLKVHLPHGFFGPGGFEYPLTLLVANLTLALSGPGAAALGRGRWR